MKRLLYLLCGTLLASLMACMPSNTMYNARNYYKAAQARPLNTNGKPNAQAIDEYTKTIKKCGIIITEHKKSSQIDDAVFLMAKALYYKGNSAFQAKDQFENLLLSFPNSPHVAESNIYLAKVLREVNQSKEAEKRLDEFIRNPRFHKEHSKALLLLADYAIKDKDYAKAQYWLEKVIRDYPKTKEFREAYYLFGKNYYEQKDFVKSLDAFERMRSARRIDKELKLDASYYIALNLLELREYDKAYKAIKPLVKNESRLDKTAAVRLLKARIMFARGENRDAESEIEYITKNFPRTESAAAAYYYLGEHYYFRMGDIDKAIVNYNKVRTEFSTSPLGTLGQNNATALQNVKPKANLDSEKALTQFLEHYYQAAESFLNQLNLPDSTLATYNTVINERDSLAVKRDSVQTYIDQNQAVLDSLNLLFDAPALGATEIKEVSADSMYVGSLTLPSAADSIVVINAEKPQEDSLAVIEPIAKEVAETDSSFVKPDAEVSSTSAVDKAHLAGLSVQKDKLQNSIKNSETQITLLTEIINRFDTEIIPFCLFAKGSVLKDRFPDSPLNAEPMQQLDDNYPNSKYTRALRALQNNQTVRLIDPEEDRQEQALDNLLGRIVAEPDSAIAGLEQLRNSTYPAVKLAATYRLGWYYSFEAVDTVAAKPYLNAVLEDAQSAEYSVVTRRFFDGKKFLLRNPVMLEKIELDSTATTAMDSINTLKLIPAFMDSLAISIPPSLVVPDSLRKYLSGSHINNGAASEPDSVNVEELKPPNTTDTRDQSELTPVEKPALPEAPILKEEEPPLE